MFTASKVNRYYSNIIILVVRFISFLATKVMYTRRIKLSLQSAFVDTKITIFGRFQLAQQLTLPQMSFGIMFV